MSAAIRSLEARSRGSRQGWRRVKTMIGRLQEGLTWLLSNAVE